MTGTQPDEAVAASASVQAVVETVTPVQETEHEQPVLAKGDGAVQAAGEADAGEVTPMSNALAVVAQQPGAAQQVQKSRGLHDLLGHAPPATPAPAAAGEETQQGIVSGSTGSVVSTAPATPAPASGGGEGTGGGRGQASATSLDLLATAACLDAGTVASEGGSASESGSGSENEGGGRH